MALTDFCDVFASVNEQAFNQIVSQFQRQRPSIFNYGTKTFKDFPKLLCDQTLIQIIDPEVYLYHNDVVHELPLLGIPGDSSGYGLEYCIQFSGLSIDFHPSNAIHLPVEMNPPLKEQRFALEGKVCAGLGCPKTSTLLQVAPSEDAFFPQFGNGVIKQPKRNTTDKPTKKDGPLVTTTPTHPLPFDRENVLCFCLELFAIFHIELGGPANSPFISLKLDDIDLVDIKPEGMKESAICFIRTMLILSILPKVKLALNALVFNVADTVTIKPTPISANVPNNPAIEDDQIKIFISLI